MKVQLVKIAHARSGDKGDTANIGLIALKPEHYPILVREVTAERVKQHFAGICKGEVERFELPNLNCAQFPASSQPGRRRDGLIEDRPAGQDAQLRAASIGDRG